MFATDAGSERATSTEDYQNTCTEFITDISRDYMDWVDRYQLSDQETARRRAAIGSIVRTTNDWIVKYGNTIKKVDIVMNDGVNKMAETTAGYPFKFDIFVNKMNHYATHPLAEIRMNIRAMPRPFSDTSAARGSGVLASNPRPWSTTRMTQSLSASWTCTSYSSPACECSSTLVHASVRATSMSPTQSSSTPSSRNRASTAISRL